MAEGRGFEPPIQFYPYGALAKPCLRPLGHPSVSGLVRQTDRKKSARRISELATLQRTKFTAHDCLKSRGS